MKNTELTIIGYKIISLKIQKFIQDDLSTSIMLISCFLGLFFGLASINPFFKIIGNDGLSGMNDIGAIIILMFFIIIAISVYTYLLTKIGNYVLINPIISKLTKIEQAITTVQVKIGKDIKSTQDIDEILVGILYNKLLVRNRLGNRGLIYGFKYIPRKMKLEFSSAVKDIFEWIMDIVLNLHSDLSIRLAEQEKILESAKSEVEKNISGTTELNQVSELQRARLDRQIEQFEELQRVLVKL